MGLIASSEFGMGDISCAGLIGGIPLEFWFWTIAVPQVRGGPLSFAHPIFVCVLGLSRDLAGICSVGIEKQAK